jgi:hypothetical protein
MDNVPEDERCTVRSSSYPSPPIPTKLQISIDSRELTKSSVSPKSRRTGSSTRRCRRVTHDLLSFKGKKVKKDDGRGNGEGDGLGKEGEQSGVGVGHALRGVIDSLSNLAKWSSHS